MVIPGAVIRKPLVNCWLLGRRTAFMVCQAMSIAITVVFPVPVAIFRATLRSSGLASLLAPRMWSNMPRNSLSGLRSPTGRTWATSVSQIIVSAAST